MVRAKKASTTSSRKTKSTAAAEPTNFTVAASESHTVAVAPSNGDVSADQIRDRAYQIYVERGRTHGHDLDDWFRAEAELTLRKTKTHFA